LKNLIEDKMNLPRFKTKTAEHITTSEKETILLAKKLAESFQGYDVVLLAGELGGISGEPIIVKARRRAITWWDILEDLLGLASKVTREGVSLEYSFK